MMTDQTPRTEAGRRDVDEVWRRWHRRRYRIQQRERAMADLRAAIEPPLVRILEALNRVLGHD